MWRYARRTATARATVPFPAPDGPSIATINGVACAPGTGRIRVRRHTAIILRDAFRAKSALFRRAARARHCALVAVGTIGGYQAFDEYVRAAAFVVRAAGMHGAAETRRQSPDASVTERDLRIPWRDGELPARWYLPAKAKTLPVLLVPGVHAAGIDEPRLVGVARDLASVGAPVLTTELADLKRYAITARSTDMIEDAAAWLAQQRDRRSDRTNRDDRDQLRRRVEHRGGRPSADSRSRGFRDVVRRARRSAAHVALFVHRTCSRTVPSVHRTTMASRSSCSASPSASCRPIRSSRCATPS